MLRSAKPHMLLGEFSKYHPDPDYHSHNLLTPASSSTDFYGSLSSIQETKLGLWWYPETAPLGQDCTRLMEAWLKLRPRCDEELLQCYLPTLPEFSSTDQPPEKIYHCQIADTQICQHICAAEIDGSQHWIMVRFATLSSCKALAVPFNPWKRSTSGISSWLCIWMLQSKNNNVSWSAGHILRCPGAFLSYRVAISKWQNRNKTIYPHALVSLQSKPDRYLAMSAASLKLLNPWINWGNVHLEAWFYSLPPLNLV